jgi:hypothetical protein
MDPTSEPADIESGVGDVTTPVRGRPTMVRGSMTAGRRGAGFTPAGRSAGRGTSCVIRSSRSAGRSIRGGRSVGIDIDLNAQGREDDEPIEVEAEITVNNSVSNFLTHGHC